VGDDGGQFHDGFLPANDSGGTKFLHFAVVSFLASALFWPMPERTPAKPKTGMRKYNACLGACILAGIIASSLQLFGDSLGLSLMGLLYGTVVGAVTYVFCLCAMVFLGFFLRGKFGQKISNVLCWLLLMGAPVFTWLVASATSARF
jgi:hypothetical protein